MGNLTSSDPNPPPIVKSNFASIDATITADVAAAKARAAAIAAKAGPFLAQAKADLAAAKVKIAASEGPVLTFIKAHYTKLVYALLGAFLVYMFSKVL
jgi:hypothetical protein